MSGRKTKTLPVPTGPHWADNRDSQAHRVYLITEWPAARAEKWGLKMFITLKGSGTEIPESQARLGMVGVAIAGINTFLRAEIDQDVLIPLLDEMMECIQIIRDPRHPEIASPIAVDDDIEDVQTRLWLRSEVILLHTGFSPADALFALISASMSSTSLTM